MKVFLEMKFFKTKIKNLYLIKHDSFFDNRGNFIRKFCQKEFRKFKLDNKISQASTSFNPHRGTLRGFHYQIFPYAETKTVSCLQGEVYDVVVDLRRSSKTFMKWVSFTLKGQDNKSIYVPKGCAHAFLTLKKNTLLNYYFSTKHMPHYAAGIKYNDPNFGFKWPFKPKVISKTDNSYLPFNIKKLKK